MNYTITKVQIEQVINAIEDQTSSYTGEFSAAVTMLQGLLAQPEGEPVAWTTMPEAEDWCFISGADDPNKALAGKWFPLYNCRAATFKPITADDVTDEMYKEYTRRVYKEYTRLCFADGMTERGFIAALVNTVNGLTLESVK